MNYGMPTHVDNPDYDSSATIANPDYDPNVPESPDNTPTIPDPIQVPLIDNPETISQFANKIVRQFLADNVTSHEINAAKQAAALNADTSVDISDPLS